MKADDLMLGVSAAVLGFVAWKTLGSGALSKVGGSSSSSAAQSWGPLAGSLNSTSVWSDGSTQVDYNNAFTSSSWNPFNVSGLISLDTAAAMRQTGQGTINTYGFTL